MGHATALAELSITVGVKIRRGAEYPQLQVGVSMADEASLLSRRYLPTLEGSS